eukprot:2919066-Amphidinium_carterae.1
MAFATFEKELSERFGKPTKPEDRVVRRGYDPRRTNNPQAELVATRSTRCFGANFKVAKLAQEESYIPVGSHV